MGSIFLSQDQHTRARTPTSGKAGRVLFSRPRPTPAHTQLQGRRGAGSIFPSQGRHPQAPHIKSGWGGRPLRTKTDTRVPHVQPYKRRGRRPRGGQGTEDSISARPRLRRLDLAQAKAPKTRSREGHGSWDSIPRGQGSEDSILARPRLRRLDLAGARAPKTRSRRDDGSEDSISRRLQLRRLDPRMGSAECVGPRQ